MTIITETRWRCDYDKCMAISPVIEVNKEPFGWIECIPKNLVFWNTKHFCCENHRQQWEALRHD